MPVSGIYLNTGVLLKKKCTGIPNTLRALRGNGSPDPVIETDETRSYFRITMFVNPVFLSEEPHVKEDRTGLSLETMVLTSIRDNGSLSMRELSEMLGYSKKRR